MNRNYTKLQIKCVNTYGPPPAAIDFQYDEYVVVRFKSGHLAMGRVLQATCVPHGTKGYPGGGPKVAIKVLVYRARRFSVMVLAGQIPQQTHRAIDGTLVYDLPDIHEIRAMKRRRS